MTRRFVRRFAMLTTVVLAGWACSDSVGTDAARLRVLLTDAPNPMFDKATVTISSISLTPSEGGEPVPLTDPGFSRTFDLLQLQNGATETLADLAVTPGTYTQLRMVVSDASVTLAGDLKFEDDSKTYALKVPSGAQSGIKINLHPAEGDDGSGLTITGQTTLVVDFDVIQNFKVQGSLNSGFKSVLFTPSLRAVVVEGAGSISGRVTDGTDPKPGVVVSAVRSSANLGVDETDVATATTDENGNYTIRFLLPDTYTVSVEGADPPQTVTVGMDEDVSGIDFTFAPPVPSVTVLLTDAPNPEFSKVEVTISEISLVPGNGGQGLVLTDETIGPLDLLQLQDGVTETLVDLVVPEGFYSQLRIVVSDATVTLAQGTFPGGSDTKSLKIPSGAQSGIKVKLRPADGDLSGNGNGGIHVSRPMVLVVDFDVLQNFRIQGNPGTSGVKGVLFTPLLRATVRDGAGSISGIVTDGSLPIEGATITAVRQGMQVDPDETNMATAVSDVGGAYTLHFLLPGVYDVSAEFDGNVSGTQVVEVLPGEDVTGIDLVIAAEPTQLIFLDLLPSNGSVGEPLTPAPAVAFANANGSVVSNQAGLITIALEGTTNAILSGTFTQEATGGIATFPDLAIDLAGESYQLRATSDGGLEGLSDPFNITLPSIYVSNFDDATVTAIETATNTQIGQPISVADNSTWGMAISPDGLRVYATSRDGTMSVISTTTLEVLESIPLGADLRDVVVTPNGRFAYVLNIGSVMVVDLASNTQTATIPTGIVATDLAVSPDGSRVYVTNRNIDVGTISVIETATNTVLQEVPVDPPPSGVDVSPDGAFVYVANYVNAPPFDPTLLVIDAATNTVVDEIALPSSRTVGVTVTPDGSQVYVALQDANEVAVIDVATNSVQGTIPVGDGPLTIAFTPDGAFAYVVNASAGSVSVIRTVDQTVVDVVPVGSSPLRAVVMPAPLPRMP